MHLWSGLAAAPVLILLAGTALPLIFRSELNSPARTIEPAAQSPSTSPVTLDRVLDAAQRSRPGGKAQFIISNESRSCYSVVFGSERTDPESRSDVVLVSRANGTVLATTLKGEGKGQILNVFANWHHNLGSEQYGPPLLVSVVLLFLTTVVSGVIVYGPFAHRMNFGDIRTKMPLRIALVDLHKLFSAATLVWLLVIGITGGMNCVGEQLITRWRSDQLEASGRSTAQRTAPLPGRISAEAAVQAALSKVPFSHLALLAMPGSRLASQNVYVVYLQGETRWSSLLWRPVMVEIANSRAAHVSSTPLPVQAMLISHSLHRGSFGGLAMKSIWAVFDLVLLGTVVTGVLIWIAGLQGKAKTSFARQPLVDLNRKVEGES